MASIILFETPTLRQQLLPLSYTRPVSELRIGILTIKEKWAKRLQLPISYLTAQYLAPKFPTQYSAENLLINAAVVANDAITEAIQSLEINEVLMKDDFLIAARIPENVVTDFDPSNPTTFITNGTITTRSTDADFITVSRPWHIFQHNGAALEDDFNLMTNGRTSQPLSTTNTVLGDRSKIFLEEGAKVECAILNTNGGSIYIGKNAEIMEGCVVRGGLAMAEKSVLKMGAKIYGATTLGTYCKVGGEVNNSVMIAYSNKGHEGFLGNSVLGEWCNLGADTNNSNLKNNYQQVKLWDYTLNKFRPTGLQFCGLIAGDHTKSGINTMFNTGTVAGVSCNIYGGGFPRNFLPSFTWGGASGFSTYRIDKAFETAETMMARRKQPLTQIDMDILTHIFETTATYRTWDKRK